MFEEMLVTVHNYFGLAGLITFVSTLILLKWWSQIKSVYSSLFAALFKGTAIFSPRSILISKLTYWIDFKINHIRMPDKGRQMIFRDLLFIKFKTFREKVFDIEKRPDFNTLNRRELYSLIVDCLYETIQRYEERALTSGIPPIVIEKFNEWHNTTVEFALKSAELITQSPVYKTNTDVICGMYLLHAAMLEVTIAEAEKTLTDLNGEITGIEYKGTIIGV